jgi:hypothetical protein
MAPVEVSDRVRVFMMLGAGLRVVVGCEVAPVSGIMPMCVLAGTVVISIIGLEGFSCRLHSKPGEKINTIPAPMEKEKSSITINMFLLKFILLSITFFLSVI